MVNHDLQALTAHLEDLMRLRDHLTRLSTKPISELKGWDRSVDAGVRVPQRPSNDRLAAHYLLKGVT